MNDRAFPVIYAADVEQTAYFYEQLRFERRFQLPPEGEAGYVGLQRGDYELAVVSDDWPQDQYGVSVGEQPRFEMFIYVEDVDATTDRVRSAGSTILKEASDMPWGERIAYVTDPSGNPVALAMASAPRVGE